MSDLTPNDVKENEFVYYEDPVTRQELKFLVIDVADELFSNGFTCRLMLLDEPKHAIKTCNNVGSASFSVPRQTRQVADNAYTFRDEFGEWPSSDVILLSRCYTKHDYDKPFMSAERARELAENSLNIKERVALRIEDAAKSGEFETYLTDEEFKICKSDLVEQNYEVSNNRVSWGDQGDWGDYDA